MKKAILVAIAITVAIPAMAHAQWNFPSRGAGDWHVGWINCGLEHWSTWVMCTAGAPATRQGGIVTYGRLRWQNDQMVDKVAYTYSDNASSQCGQAYYHMERRKRVVPYSSGGENEYHYCDGNNLDEYEYDGLASVNIDGCGPSKGGWGRSTTHGVLSLPHPPLEESPPNDETHQYVVITQAFSYASLVYLGAYTMGGAHTCYNVIRDR